MLRRVTETYAQLVREAVREALDDHDLLMKTRYVVVDHLMEQFPSLNPAHAFAALQNVGLKQILAGTQEVRSGLPFREFTEQDWMGYPGAMQFRDGTQPSIYEDTEGAVFLFGRHDTEPLILLEASWMDDEGCLFSMERSWYEDKFDPVQVREAMSQVLFPGMKAHELAFIGFGRSR